MAEERRQAADCLSPSFTIHDGLTRDAFLNHEIEEFRQRLLHNEREPEIQVTPISGNRFEVCVVANGLVYGSDFNVDDEGLITSNGNIVECVPKVRRHKGLIERAVAIRSHDFLIQTITPKFPVLECHVTMAPEAGLFSYFHFLNGIDPAQSFIGSLRVMMKNAKSANVVIEFPGLERFTEWQEKEFFPIIQANTVKVPIGKSRPWNVSAWLDDSSCVSIDRPEPGLEWALKRPVKKAMVTDALDNDWVVEVGQ
jgi:hypothetical protein